ncbi:hypothetical protein CLCR_11095 [Cladophialophora carrionii]|uniref:Uncharacterized protein n=1 Tax=Cladophialophora carrionii TaxID=86049 RepID=A0A1C1CVV0_9EURO|nr:hypothetical protein CLCR_11095 [Cladophialophora carrionii]
MGDELAELKAEVKRLHAKLQKVEAKPSMLSQWILDEAEIRKVHFKYGYYLDKCLYQEVSRSPFAFPPRIGDI